MNEDAVTDHSEDVARALEVLRSAGYLFEVRPPLDWQPWMDQFLAAYEEHEKVTIASGRSGVSPPTVYKYYLSCSSFGDRVDAIKPLRTKTARKGDPGERKPVDKEMQGPAREEPLGRIEGEPEALDEPGRPVAPSGERRPDSSTPAQPAKWREGAQTPGERRF